MPVRDDLTEPIPGDNPSGSDLYYDKVFLQLKEASFEEEDTLPAGDWGRTPKKADHNLVIKLAGEALAKRSKDIRLANYLVESQFKREGFSVLVPGLNLLKKIEETFWPTFYPVIDEDGNVDRRLGAVESFASGMGKAIRNAPITRSGLSAVLYGESRSVGYESDAGTNEKLEARNDAIQRGKVTAEEFDRAFANTPKEFYVTIDTAITAANELLDEIDRVHEEKYGSEYPNMGKLRSALQDVGVVVRNLLDEKRKLEPDAATDAVGVEQSSTTQIEAEANSSIGGPASLARKASIAPGGPSDANQAYQLTVACMELLRSEDPYSPVPYLVCSGLRLGETRKQGSSPDSDFAIAPSTEVRQRLRRLVSDSNWDELLRQSLPVLGDRSARAWLDLHRYIWSAAYQSGYSAVAVAVAATVRSLLQDIPEVRHWTLDDDTPAANFETQQWIDAEILPAASAPQGNEADLSQSMIASAASGTAEPVAEIYDAALELLKSGKTREAISMMVHDSELQPSGRMRFQRRVQVAQLCLTADQDPIAYPILMDLSAEIERRGLETWESGAMLAHPLSLLLKCLDRRKNSSDDRDAIFSRLCRLDPQSAITTSR
jgi:type VI secretion system protein ImpA